jgi:23S rRNA pseudouridine1911/1915/1917 synthase
VERLDQYVVRQKPSLSRSSAVKLVEDGKVSVNDAVQFKPAYRVKPEDVIAIDYDETARAKVPHIDLPVLYEDDDCVVISKPAGVLSHSKGAFNPEATVATWLAGRVKGLTGERAGIVHRLDRGTSGVMICAKTPEALTWLQKQFSERKTVKQYAAVVSGEPDEPEAVIDMPIERNPKRPQTFRTGAGGKHAVTAYKVMKTGNGRALLELRPTTGRTHQLRLHLSKIGHPIVGDELYGGAAGARLFLHAESLRVTLPARERKTFEAPVPPEFAEGLRA